MNELFSTQYMWDQSSMKSNLIRDRKKEMGLDKGRERKQTGEQKQLCDIFNKSTVESRNVISVLLLAETCSSHNTFLKGHTRANFRRRGEI